MPRQSLRAPGAEARTPRRTRRCVGLQTRSSITSGRSPRSRKLNVARECRVTPDAPQPSRGGTTGGPRSEPPGRHGKFDPTPRYSQERLTVRHLGFRERWMLGEADTSRSGLSRVLAIFKSEQVRLDKY